MAPRVQNPPEPSDPKAAVNAKQARLVAERVRQAKIIGDAPPEGTRGVKIVEGVRYVLVNGGWRKG